jgi:hypothetical protein
MLAPIWASNTGTNHLAVLSKETWTIHVIGPDGPQLWHMSRSSSARFWTVHACGRTVRGGAEGLLILKNPRTRPRERSHREGEFQGVASVRQAA